MTQPKVNIFVQDGALGVQALSTGGFYAVVGPSTQGPFVPSVYARSRDIINTYGKGPGVEAACVHVDLTGDPVLFCRTAASIAGLPETIDTSLVEGTSEVTVTGVPNDDYDAVFVVVTGGTVGAPGITFQYSLDGGRTLSPVRNLGAASTFPIPEAGSLSFAFGIGTLNAGDIASTRTVAPRSTAAEIGDALEACRTSAQRWDVAHIATPLDGDGFDIVETKILAMEAIGKYVAWIANVRVPAVNETEAAYLSAMVSEFGDKQTLHGMLCFGADKQTSSVSGRKYRRPVSFVVSPFQAKQSEEEDIANINLGSLPGISIRDRNGNPDEHDESLSPGADDARFTTLRTWEGEPGVYVNRPRVFSSDTSDFQLFPHVLVMNIALRALRAFFNRRLSKPIEVDTKTGFIAEHEAIDIENGATQAMSSVLRAKPKCSGVQFVLSRTDNILSTKTLTGDARVIPLGYPEAINLTVGFLNPSLQVIAA